MSRIGAAFERFDALMQDGEGENSETSVDVEVRVEESVEEATAISEEATSVVETSEVADGVVEEVEAAESLGKIIEKHGLQPGLMEYANVDYIGQIAGKVMPSVESLDATGRNPEAAQAALEAIGEMVSKGWAKIKEFFKMVYEKVKALVAKVVNFFSKYEGAIRRSKESLKDIEVDKKKEAAKTANLMKYADFTTLSKGVTEFTVKLEKMITNKKSVNVADTSEIKAMGIDSDKDGNLTVREKAVGMSEMKLKASGWTKEVCEGDGYKAAESVVAAMRQLPKLASAMDSLCKSGIAAAESLAKSRDEKESEKVKELQKAASAGSKGVGVVSGRAGIVPRAYIAACAAVRACAA